MINKEKNLDRAIILLLAVLTIVVTYNQVQINGISKLSLTGFAVATNNDINSAANNIQTAGSVIPTGVPNIYGNELGVSYDDISPYDQSKADLTIRRLAYLDQNIELNQQELQRYINIGLKISCEYCCG